MFVQSEHNPSLPQKALAHPQFKVTILLSSKYLSFKILVASTVETCMQTF